MKQNADVDGAEELTRMQDDFYKLEKDAMDLVLQQTNKKNKQEICIIRL